MKIRNALVRALLCAALIVCAVLFASCGETKEKVELADLTGYTQSDVIDWSVENGVADKFNFTFENSDTVPADYVIRTTPDAGSKIGDSVDVVISAGAVADKGIYAGAGYSFGDEEEETMPNLVGLVLRNAVAALRTLNYAPGYLITYEESDAPVDTVIRTYPMAGRTLNSLYDVKTPIEVVVSSGSPLTETVTITFPVTDPDGKVVKVYVNDVLQGKGIGLISDSAKGNSSVTVRGSGNAAMVRIVVENYGYDLFGNAEYTYLVDFENGTYREYIPEPGILS